MAGFILFNLDLIERKKKSQNKLNQLNNLNKTEMKKFILVFAVLAFTAGHYAHADSAYTQKSPPNKNKTQNQSMHKASFDKSIPDGVMMRNGEVMRVSKGGMTTLHHEMTMTDGTTIMTDGTYHKNDGTRNMLKDGQHIDMEGNLTLIKAKKDRDMYLVPDSIARDSLRRKGLK